MAPGGAAITRHRHGAGTGWYVSTNLDTATLATVMADVYAGAGLAASGDPDGPEASGVSGELEGPEALAESEALAERMKPYSTRRKSFVCVP